MVQGGPLPLQGRVGAPFHVRVRIPWYLAGVQPKGIPWGFSKPINSHYRYRAYIGISHRGTLGSGYIQLSPE